MARRQILSISGGGYAGLFAAKCLALLESELPPGKSIVRCFDAIAGTSVGGLIALALANGHSAQQILDTMLRDGASVFHRRFGASARSLWGPRHLVEPLRKQVRRLLGDTRLGDLKLPTLITSLSLSNGRPTIFRARPGKSDSHSRLKLTDVALATSAAPLYFPPHKIENELYVDGGLIANAPDHLAVVDALTRYGWAREDLTVLSIGTTQRSPGFLTHKTSGWGLRRWLRGKKLLALAMHGQMALAQEVSEALLLPGRLHRIDATLSEEQSAAIALDVATKQATATLQALAQRALDQFQGLPRAQLLNHTGLAP